MTDDKKEKNNNMESGDSPYSSLTGSFGNVELEARDRFYTLKEAEPLLNKLKAAVRESQNGARLLDLAESKGAKFYLIKSKRLQSATTPKLEVFLAAEPDQEEPFLTQILEFGGALREIEQYLMGFKMPDKDSDPLEKANMGHTKFLDKIVYMCRIGIDLESIYSEKVQEAIKAFGYEDIYNAQASAAGDQETIDVYMASQSSKA